MKNPFSFLLPIDAKILNDSMEEISGNGKTWQGGKLGKIKNWLIDAENDSEAPDWDTIDID